MAGVLVYSDKTKLATELLSAANLIGEEVYAVSINNDEQVNILTDSGVNVLKISQTELSQADTAAIASALKQTAQKINADVILLSSTKTGKELAGRLAQLLEAGCLTDVGKITINSSAIECTRNALGGATVAVQVIKTTKKVIAISPKAFNPAEAKLGGSVTDLVVDVKDNRIKLLEVRDKTVESVDIETAEALVAVGQGLDNQNQLAQVEEIAKALNAEVACSKPVATDKKWLSEARIIGISGRICKPQLAILMGISGQVQFSVGIRDAQTIIAINNDENAPLCDMADYVLIADLKDIIPELNLQIKQS